MNWSRTGGRMKSIYNQNSKAFLFSFNLGNYWIYLLRIHFPYPDTSANRYFWGVFPVINKNNTFWEKLKKTLSIYSEIFFTSNLFSFLKSLLNFVYLSHENLLKTLWRNIRQCHHIKRKYQQTFWNADRTPDKTQTEISCLRALRNACFHCKLQRGKWPTQSFWDEHRKSRRSL